MGDGERARRAMTVRLPSGAPIRVEVAESESSDTLTSVGLRNLELDTALDTIAEISSNVIEKLKAAKPSRASVELKFGFSVEAGKLTALWINGGSDASLTVTLEWSERPAPGEKNDG
jgi:hypothetical protein